MTGAEGVKGEQGGQLLLLIHPHSADWAASEDGQALCAGRAQSDALGSGSVFVRNVDEVPIEICEKRGSAMGTDKNNSLTAPAGLRRQAEEQLKADTPESGFLRPKNETERLLHELQVHQIELEMQNAELRQVREDLEISLGKYTGLYDFAPVGYFTLDRHGAISAVNLSSASLIGIARSRLVGQHFARFVTEAVRPLFSDFLAKVFASQGKESCEIALTTGGNHPLLVQLEAVAFGSGQECRVAAIDITERKKAEEASRSSEALYRAIGESIDYGIWICDPDGRNTYASKSFLHLTGMTQEQCSDFGWGEVLHPDDAERTIAAWKECVRTGGPWDIEHRFRGADGQWHPILARGVAVRDDHGTITCWAGINLDISCMKDAEKKLRESEERLRLALSASQMATWDWHVPNGTLIWNDEHYRMMGYEPGEVTPSYRAWVDRLHPDDIASTEASIKEHMADGKDFTVEFRTLWPDGTVRWLEARGKFERDAAGQNLRGYGVMIDRTDRKLVENALRQAHDELEIAIIELDAFNYTVSHDLRKPLTVINSYCQVLQELCGSKLDEQCRQYIRAMYDGTLRMNQLIDTLLDFSRITSVEMRRDKVDLSKMAQEVAMDLKVTSAGRGVTFRIAPGIVVEGDSGLLRVVLDNLIGNACKYAGNQEGAVIEFGMMDIDGTSACFIRDNGPGFDMSQATTLFIPFHRLPGAKVAGHGIGLATTERIVKRHGGRIWAEGEMGKGACFYFTLSAD
jgi:PAS domain S-box-containing protein